MIYYESIKQLHTNLKHFHTERIYSFTLSRIFMFILIGYTYRGEQIPKLMFPKDLQYKLHVISYIKHGLILIAHNNTYENHTGVQLIIGSLMNTLQHLQPSFRMTVEPESKKAAAFP